MTEATRKRNGIRPPDVSEWNRQMVTIRLFHQLIWARRTRLVELAQEQIAALGEDAVLDP